MPCAAKRVDGFHWPFFVAWLFALVFYFLQYGLRSAPSVMVSDIEAAYGLSALGFSSLIGVYYYTLSAFALVAGACLDRYGAKHTIPIGVATLAAGSILFVLGSVTTATTGRLLQGAGSAAALPGAVYLAAQGFPARYLATVVGLTQAAGLLGGSAGQFGVALLIDALPSWRAFWIYAGALLIVLAGVMVFTTPDSKPAATAESSSLASILSPFRIVLSNPQSYLCGIVAGLLFLPTTIGSMIWGVRILHTEGVVNHLEAVIRASTVPFGWVIGAPLLGYVADRTGRRKPTLIGGGAFVLVMAVVVLYLPSETPPYLGGFLLGLGSGAAVIPYSMIKEVNPDNVKGSAIGVMNFLVFSFSALLAPVYGALLTYTSAGAALTLKDFQQAGILGIGLIALAIVASFFLKETGAASQKPAIGGTQPESGLRKTGRKRC